MTEYKIRLSGCDDDTIVYMVLNRNEHILMERLSMLTLEESKDSCMPRLYITREDD